MAIPNIAQGYLNQVRAARDRALENQKQREFQQKMAKEQALRRFGYDVAGNLIQGVVGLGAKAADREIAKLQANPYANYTPQAAYYAALDKFQGMGVSEEPRTQASSTQRGRKGIEPGTAQPKPSAQPKPPAQPPQPSENRFANQALDSAMQGFTADDSIDIDFDNFTVRKASELPMGQAKRIADQAKRQQPSENRFANVDSMLRPLGQEPTPDPIDFILGQAAAKKVQSEATKPTTLAAKSEAPAKTSTVSPRPAEEPARPGQKTATTQGTTIVARTPSKPAAKPTPQGKKIISTSVVAGGDLDNLSTTPKQLEGGTVADLYTDPRQAGRARYEQMLAAVQRDAEKKFPPLPRFTSQQLAAMDEEDKFLLYNARAARKSLIDRYVQTQTNQLAASDRFASIGQPTISQITSANRFAEKVKQDYNPGTARGRGNIIKKALADGAWTVQSTYLDELRVDASAQNKAKLDATLTPAQLAIVQAGGNVPVTRPMTRDELLFTLTRQQIKDAKVQKLARKGGVRYVNNTPFISVQAVTPSKYVTSAGQKFDLLDRKHLERLASGKVGTYIVSYQTALGKFMEQGLSEAEAKRRAEPYKGKQQQARDLAKNILGQLRYAKNPKLVTPEFRQSVQNNLENLRKIVDQYTDTTFAAPQQIARQEKKDADVADKKELTLADLKANLSAAEGKVTSQEQLIRNTIPDRLQALKNSVSNAQGKLNAFAVTKLRRYTRADMNSYIKDSGYIPSSIAKPPAGATGTAIKAYNTMVSNFQEWAKTNAGAFKELQNQKAAAEQNLKKFTDSIGKEGNYNVQGIKAGGESINNKMKELQERRNRVEELKQRIKNREQPGDQGSLQLDDEDRRFAQSLMAMSIPGDSKQMRMFRYLKSKYPEMNIPVPPAMMTPRTPRAVG